MKIDKRKKSQSFINKNGLNSVYCWKQKDGYKVGINGTCHHFGGMNINSANDKIKELINLKA